MIQNGAFLSMGGAENARNGPINHRLGEISEIAPFQPAVHEIHAYSCTASQNSAILRVIPYAGNP
jgi:hypothetical protein